MKRTKRKYTRKAPTTPVESSRGDLKAESSTIPQPDNIQSSDGFSFNDLPLSVRVGVEKTIKLSKRLKLPDDSEERKSRAIKMFRGDKAR